MLPRGLVKEAEKENKAENGIKNEPIRKAGKEETTEAPSSQSIEYYLKHRINEKLIEELVDNHRFSDSLSEARVEKIKGRTYNLLPRGPVYEAILRKKITRKEDIRGNFEIPNFSFKMKKDFSQCLKTASGLTPDGVTSPAVLYLIRRSLEVLRNFYWTILGGRFDQLSHVSSPLLSKPGEY
ncbi:hypothetical protein Tco_0175566 [Tanacetum coccineum]